MRKNISLALAAVILTLIGLEVGLRIYLANYGDERQKVLYLYSREEIREKQKLFRGMAFLNYGLSPTDSNVNSLGYRGPEIVVPKPSDTFRIVTVGGSTTYGLFLQPQQAYPRQLQEALQENYGSNHVEIINAGIPGYSTWESAVNLLLRIPDLEPDMVIIYHGINDVGVRMTDPDFFDGLNSSKGYWTDADHPLPFSSILRIGLKKLGFELEIAYGLAATFRRPEGVRDCMLETVAADAYCRGFDMSVSDLFNANPPVYFERNLLNMVRLTHGMDSEVLLLTWAYSPLDFPIPGGGGMVHRYLQDGVAEHNAIVRKIADGEGTLFYDLAASMPIDEKYWVNGIHMNATGTQEMARQLADYLAASGRLDN